MMRKYAINQIVPIVVGLTTLMIFKESLTGLTFENVKSLVLKESLFKYLIYFGAAYAANGGKALQAVVAVYLFDIFVVYMNGTDDGYGDEDMLRPDQAFAVKQIDELKKEDSFKPIVSAYRKKTCTDSEDQSE